MASRPPRRAPGLGLLDFETTLANEKTLENVSGTLTLQQPGDLRLPHPHGRDARPGAIASGDDARRRGGPYGEGAISDDGQIMATYCHGLFDSPEALSALLEWTGYKPTADFDPNARRERDLDRLADALEASIDLKLLAQWLPGLALPEKDR